MVVVDASFLMAVFIEETHTDFARGVYSDLEGEDMAAPALVMWEFANILWKKRRRGEITDENIREADDYLASLTLTVPVPIATHEVAELSIAALRHQLTAYDTSYLLLALEMSAALATIDKNLTRAAVAAGVIAHSPFA